jgi:glycolate oxidase FAD binding subunit
MGKVWTPGDASEVEAVVREALDAELTLELIGRGTRRAFGRPVQAEGLLDLSLLAGVTSYQPEELVITLGPATLMRDLEDMLTARNQHLAFEPPDFGPLWGLAAGAGTIGGTMITGRGGPRRLTAGGPRDHLLGIKGVNGFGEAFGAGGRVVKNVTGFDITKLVTGSFGTLCAITEMSLKVLPAPEDCATLVISGLTDEAAVAVMSLALGSSAQVSSAAHLPSAVARDSALAAISADGSAKTLLRIEGVTPSVTARIAHLRDALTDSGAQTLINAEESRRLWKEIADASFFAGTQAPVIWKLSVAPTIGGALGSRLAAELDGRCFYDWGGGGVWLELPPAPDAHAPAVRSLLKALAGDDGHATLMRAPDSVRLQVEPFQPLPVAVEALTARIRAQFDPKGVFNPGRMLGVR